MKRLFIILLVLNLTSCSSSKDITIKTNYEDLEIFENTKSSTTDTTNHNELRFYDIESAYDTMKLMYLDFGFWDEQKNSLYMPFTKRKIWKDITLFDNNETFTVIADGTETRKEYFACLKVIDSKGKDCLERNHPLKEKIISHFYKKMKESKKKQINYWIING
ncbi:MAG: hypothetical protein ACQESK_05250 [Bacteroidota bacterium]